MSSVYFVKEEPLPEIDTVTLSLNSTENLSRVQNDYDPPYINCSLTLNIYKIDNTSIVISQSDITTYMITHPLVSGNNYKTSIYLKNLNNGYDILLAVINGNRNLGEAIGTYSTKIEIDTGISSNLILKNFNDENYMGSLVITALPGGGDTPVTPDSFPNHNVSVTNDYTQLDFPYNFTNTI